MFEKWLGIEKHQGFDPIDDFSLQFYSPVFNEKGKQLFGFDEATSISILLESGKVELFSETSTKPFVTYNITDLVLVKEIK